MATLKDIALRTGVNISTVSRALNNNSEISEETKNLIKNVAKELNYVPDITAQALAGKGTNSIGVIVPEISSNYYGTMLNCIESELKKNGYSLIVGMAHHRYQDERLYLDVFRTRRVDGILLAGPMNKRIKSDLDKVNRNNRIPVVLIHTFISYDNYDYVFVDDVYGVDAAISLLKRQGHRRLGYVADELSSKFRIDKIRRSVLKHGLELDERHTKIGKETFEMGGYLQMKRLLEEPQLPTAVLASYDYIAIGAMRALTEAGLSVPGDMSIIGYDDIRESAYLPCPLTTISPPTEEMVKISTEILFDKIRNIDSKEIRHISLKPELVIRSSTADIRNRDYSALLSDQ